MILKKVISGGQTGADIGALRAAKDSGIETGGWIPRGFRTERGPKTDRGSVYGLVETDTTDYLSRTGFNVRDSDITLWFGFPKSPGGYATKKACKFFKKEFICTNEMTPRSLAEFLVKKNVSIINVAGNRESTNPDIEEATYRFLMLVFEEMQKPIDWPPLEEQ